jgi:Xaa-Pro aminopeptidase
LDYGHGTGHGVGHFSSVHEGPQGITKQNTVILKENMIVSIEPGYYREGHFGMRIENLYAIKKSSKYNGFLEFEMLTMVPIETSLINFNEMNKDEIEWLSHNNRVAVEAVKNKLSEDELEFIVSNSTL